MSKNEKQQMPVLRTIAAVLANLTAILSANYIVFFILDHYNPGFGFVVHSDFILTKYLHIVIPVLLLLTALLYLLIFVGGGQKPKKLNKKRLAAILIADVLIAGAFAMTVNARAFGWVTWLRPKEAAPVAIATLPPEPTPAPTDAPTVKPTEENVTEQTPKTDAAETPAAALPTEDPTEAPTQAPTEVPTVPPVEEPEVELPEPNQPVSPAVPAVNPAPVTIPEVSYGEDLTRAALRLARSSRVTSTTAAMSA